MLRVEVIDSSRTALQPEREMTALVFGAERFHRWVYWSKFYLVTVNKALVQLLDVAMLWNSQWI